MPSNAIIVFVKNPELGKVKTRLAKTLGNQKALDIYLRLTQYTRTVLEELAWPKYVFYDQEVIEKDDWDLPLFHKRIQHSGDLGDRMNDACTQVLQEFDKLVIIGSDCPQLTANHIHAAFEALDQTDLVFGPSHDGGYYLLGMKTIHSYLFTDIPWSTSSVYGQSLTKAFEHKHSVTELEHLTDIDHEEDLKVVDWEV